MSIISDIFSIRIYILSSLCLTNCNSNPTVHYAKQLEQDVGGYYVNHPVDSTWMIRSRREVFIIENAPSDRHHLLQVIQLNEMNESIDRKKTEKIYDTFHRYYYRASWRTRINILEKSSPLRIEDIGKHTDDLICRIVMIKSYKPHLPDSLRCTWTNDCSE